MSEESTIKSPNSGGRLKAMNEVDGSAAAKPRRGVYFIANDAVLDLAIAFLNSFRRFNPTIALCLIPFDDNAKKVLRLRDRYRFSVWSDRATFDWSDAIARRFHPEHRHQHYRKLALWQAEFDEFLYIDVDTVILGNVDFVFDFLSEYDFVMSDSNRADHIKSVWRDSIYATGKLSTEQIGFAASTGFIASKRGLLSKDFVDASLDAALELAPSMELGAYEQPFLNYLMVTSALRSTSLWLLAKTHKWVRLECWAGDPTAIRRGGQIFRYDGRVEQVPALLVHWAGVWHWKGGVLDRLRTKIFYKARGLGVVTGHPKQRMRLFLRHGWLWRYYRYLGSVIR